MPDKPTAILAEAIQVAQEMSDGSGAWSLAECVEAAIRHTYPRDPSAAVIEATAENICKATEGDDWWQELNEEADPHDPLRDYRGQYRETALIAYRAHPLWIALYATSPSEPT